jgi:hypothetical protein
LRRGTVRGRDLAWHAGRMGWHWGNIGSFLAGLSTVAIAVAALIRGPAALRDWRARQRAEAEAAREEAGDMRLERRRYLSGWSPGSVATFKVTPVTQAAELARAGHQLTRQPLNSAYVMLRISEGGTQHDAARAEDLRQIIRAGQHISRPPAAGELEAAERGSTRWGSRWPSQRELAHLAQASNFLTRNPRPAAPSRGR